MHHWCLLHKNMSKLTMVQIPNIYKKYWPMVKYLGLLEVSMLTALL